MIANEATLYKDGKVGVNGGMEIFEEIAPALTISISARQHASAFARQHFSTPLRGSQQYSRAAGVARATKRGSRADEAD